MVAEDTAEEQDDSAITEKKAWQRQVVGRARSKKTKNEPQGNTITRPLFQVLDYFSNVRSELNKVAWPSQRRHPSLDHSVHQCHDRLRDILGHTGCTLVGVYAYRANPGYAWMLIAVIIAMDSPAHSR